MSKITRYVRHLAVVAMATLAAQCAWAEVTPYTHYTFNDLDVGNVPSNNETTFKNTGTNTGGEFAMTTGSIVAVDENGNKAWVFGSASKQINSAPNASVSPTTYVTTFSFNGASFSDWKIIWGTNGQAYNGPAFCVKGNATDGYQVAIIRHAGGAIKTENTYLTYDVPQTLTGYHMWALTMVYQGSAGVYTLYCDGEQVAATSAGGYWGNQNSMFGLGQGGNKDTPKTPEGLAIDDLQVYNKVLSIKEIQDLAGIETGKLKMNDKWYDTIASALADVQEGENVITLYAQIDESVTLPANVTVEATPDCKITGTISGSGTYSIALAQSNSTAGINSLFTSEQLAGFTGTVLMTKGRFEFNTAQVSLIPSAVTLATSNQGKIYLGSGEWNNHFVLAGNGWTGDSGYKMGPVALRVDGATFGESASIQAVVESDVVPAIGVYNTNPTLCAITGNGGLRLRSHNAQTITISAADLSGLTGAIILVDANATLAINVAEGTATVANNISGDGKIKKVGDGTLKCTGSNTFTGGLVIDAGTVEGTFSAPITGAGTYSIALANANSSANISSKFTEGQLADFTGKLLMTMGRFQFETADVARIPSAVTLATSNQGKIYLGSGTWNNHFVISGNGWTGDGSYKMGPVALRVDNATFGENASIQAVVESNVVPAIGIYNTNPTLCAITGNGGLRLRSHNQQTITIPAANLSGLSGAINLVDANVTLEITAAEAATVANDISGSGKIKKSGEGALTLSGAVSCAVKLAAGTIVSESVTGEVTTDVAGKHVAFDEETNTYSLEEEVTEITFTVTGLPEHAVAYIQINNGETTPIEGGTFTAAPGDKFVVWFAPAEGYVGNTLSTGVVTVVYPMQTTTIQAPSAEQMNIRPVVAIAAVGEPSIPPDLQGFGSLAEAITAGWYVFLTDAVTVDSTIVIDHSVVIDLQGHNITGNGVRVFQVKNGTVEIDSTDADGGDVIPATISTIGSINPDSSVIRIGGGDVSAAPVLTIDEGVTVTSAVCYGITAFGPGTQTLVVDGTVATTGNRPAISGNGNASNGETTITINGTVSAMAENAIYQPQAGTTTINGTVTGGIEAKAGAVTIKTDATVTARETTATHTANGDGCSTQGYAVAVVDNAGYKGGAVVTIEGGTITGPVAQVVDSEAKEANTLTITGGTFTVDPSAYVAEGYEATESEGVWTVSEKTGPTSWETVTDADVTTIVTDLPEGKTVTATELAAWAKANEVAFQSGITVPVNALIFYCAPDAIPTDVKAEADKALKQVAVDMDLLALMKEATEKGSVTIPAPDPNPYPLAVFKLVPATLGDSVTTTAELFKLSIELK